MNIVNTDGVSDKKSVEGINTFAPKEGRTYYPNDLLTIDAKTKKISKWLIDNPVELDKVRRKYKLSIEKETYLVLMSKLRADFFPYYRDVLGLKLQIVFPGYDNMVAAKVPYQDMPVKFYKWWRKNEDKITMTKKETIELLLKVNELSPTALIKKHREILEKKVI
jgi:hypothetical protein